MKEIKLWEVSSDEGGGVQANPVESIQKTDTEQLLEEVIVRCPQLLMSELKLVGRQTETPGGPLDLLGVDGDGRLAVFELKRGNLTREAVAQVIDYASYLAELDLDELSRHISERSGNLGIEKIDDFLSWYQEQFASSLTEPLKPRMILVGLGADDRTRRMVSFLADSDVDISLITFHGFKKAGKTLLARQVEVQGREGSGVTGATKKDNLARLKQKLNNLGIGSYYFDMASFFRKQLSAYEWPNPGGFAYALPELTESGSESHRVYISLYIFDSQPGKVEIRLHPRAVEAANESFSHFKKALEDRIEIRADGGATIRVKSGNEWEEMVESFLKLCPCIVEGWKKKREKQMALDTAENNNSEQKNDYTGETTEES